MRKSFVSKKNKEDKLDTGAMSMEELGSMEQVDFALLLRYTLFQITKSKSMHAFESYKQMVDLLNIFLSPYFDERFKYAAENLIKQRRAKLNSVSPMDREKFVQSLDIEFTDKKLQALVNLMARRGFLAEQMVKA